MKKIRNFVKGRPVFASVIFALSAGFLPSVLWEVWRRVQSEGVGIGLLSGDVLLVTALFAFCVIYPLLLTLLNFLWIFRKPEDARGRKTRSHFAVITWLLGIADSLLYQLICEIQWTAEWSEQLYNRQVHQPIWTGGIPTVLFLCFAGMAGYLVLAFGRLEKLPPLVTVLSMSGMYLGILECVLWCIQVMEKEWILTLLPINCIFLAAGLIRSKIAEWNELEQRRQAKEVQENAPKGMAQKPQPAAEAEATQAVVHQGLDKTGFCAGLLRRAALWPIFAFFLMWPLLGILFCILVLFGQKPDAFIKAWTETAEWQLSQQTAPPQLYFDEHYLCTVAAGGHEKIVKPLRMGERHGHRVVVNRQLCIANAFEQILEERMPRFHRAVRHFYDTYGFPVARLIKTRGAADVVYFLMKPLEWIFLAVLYLFDPKPENRIAVQYLPKRDQVLMPSFRG